MSSTFQIAGGDWVMDPSVGRPVLVSDGPKLVQDVQEMLTVYVQPNGFGAGLDGLMGAPTDNYTFQLEATQAVSAAVVALQQLQGEPPLAAQRPAAETVVGVTYLNVVPADLGGGVSQTGYLLTLTVATAATAAGTTGVTTTAVLTS